MNLQSDEAPLGYSDRVLVTIHGVTSDNSGLAKLRTYCETKLPGLICESFYYGSVIPFKELTEDTSYAVFLAVRDRLELLLNRYVKDSERRLFIAAHSFGTLATVRALEMRIPGLVVEGLFLMGSIVPRYYYWDGLIESRQIVYPPFSVVRPLDRIVRGAFAVGGGSSGASGFIANGRYRPIETFKSGGHTAYAQNDGDDLVQFIRSGAAAIRVQNREAWLAGADPWERLQYRFV
jgi:hypothetical protein